MTSRQELRAAIEARPDAMAPRVELARLLFRERSFQACLKEIQLALEHPGASHVLHELEVLESRVLEDHLEELLGPLSDLVVAKRPPGFSYGEVVELVLQVTGEDAELLRRGLSEARVSKLELLGLVVEDGINEVLSVLGSFPHRLSELNLWFRQPLSVAAFRRFSGSPVLKELEVLYLRAGRLGDGIVRLIMENTSRMVELRLRSDKRESLTEETAFILADSPASSRLEVLSIVGSELGDQGALALGTSSHLRHLERMELRDGVLTNDGARILAANTGLNSLDYLDVSFNYIDEAGLLELESLDIEIRDDHQHND